MLLAAPLLLSSCMQTDAMIVNRADTSAPAEDTAVPDAAATEPDTEVVSSPDPVPAVPLTLLVTESPYGPSPDPDTWGGVVRYSLAESGALTDPVPGIDANHLHDPWGLAWREDSGEVFVGNRHGSFGALDATGTIQRFLYDAASRTFTPNGEIAGSDLAEVHQLSFDPGTGELFAANGARGIARFRFDAGVAVANGTIESGATRGVAASPGGRKVWATSGTDAVRQFDVGTWSELQPIGTEDGAILENLTVHAGLLYAASPSTDAIYRFRIDVTEDLALLDAIDATSPVGVAFSSDGRRMYAASADGVIERFIPAEGGTWAFVDAVDAQLSLGSLIVLE